MRLSKGRLNMRVKQFASALLLFFFCGCIIPNRQLIALQEDVNRLKSENAELKEKNLREISAVTERLSKIDQELDSIQSGLGKDIRRTKADYGAEIEELRTEMSQLMGRFEEAAHFSKKTSEENQALMESVDRRMTAIEKSLSDMQERIDGYAREIESIKPAAAEPVETGQAKEEGVKIPATDVYKTGLEAIKAGNTEKARQSFRKYLEDYPNEPLANNAQFWIGESFFDEGNYEQAIIEYDDVIKKYPRGGKVPAAMLKQAMAFEKINDAKTASTLYKKLIVQHPETEQAKVAKKMLNKLKK